GQAGRVAAQQDHVPDRDHGRDREGRPVPAGDQQPVGAATQAAGPAGGGHGQQQTQGGRQVQRVGDLPQAVRRFHASSVAREGPGGGGGTGVTGSCPGGTPACPTASTAPLRSAGTGPCSASPGTGRCSRTGSENRPGRRSPGGGRC